MFLPEDGPRVILSTPKKLFLVLIESRLIFKKIFDLPFHSTLGARIRNLQTRIIDLVKTNLDLDLKSGKDRQLSLLFYSHTRFC